MYDILRLFLDDSGNSWKCNIILIHFLVFPKFHVTQTFNIIKFALVFIICMMVMYKFSEAEKGVLAENLNFVTRIHKRYHK